MHLTLTQKLTTAFLALAIIILTATLLLARWSFEQGFLDYVNALEQKRLQTLALDLSNLYANSSDGWDGLRDHELLYRIKRSAENRQQGQDGFFDGPPHLRNKPPLSPGIAPASGPRREFQHSGSTNQNHPQRRQGNRRPDRKFQRPPIDSSPRSHPSGERRRGPPPHLDFNPMPPTGLFDQQNSLVTGAPMHKQTAIEPIVVNIQLNEEIIGSLRTQPRRDLSSVQETAFAEQQRNASILIGILALVIAIILSMGLAKTLLAPVRRLQDSVSTLARGDYSVQLSPTSGDELGELMQNVDRLATTLEASQTARRRWLADISHELRTPLSILKGELEAIKFGVRKFDTQQLDSFSEEVERINALVDDLYELAIADVGALRYQFEPCDVIEVAENVVTSFNKNSANEQSAAITIQFTRAKDSPPVNADPQRLHQLFLNLLSNSRRYTDKPGEIRLVIDALPSHLQIDIHDSPPGVDDEQCTQLFEPLFRTEDSRNRNRQGAGLGLAIAKNIVEAHAGVINAQPSFLGGLHISIQLPYSGSSSKRNEHN